MEEKWIKVREIQQVFNLVKDKEIINFKQKEWEEIIKQYKVKYKFDIIQKTVYRQLGRLKLHLQSVYVLCLYTTKEDLQEMTCILKDIEKAELKIPEEVEEKQEETEIQKQSRYFCIILMILLIIFEIMIMIFTEENNEIVRYIIIAIFIIIELFAIKINLRKGKIGNKNEPK